MRRALPFVILILLFCSPVLRGQSPRPASSADLRESIDRLATVGTVLYVAAHPDDENTAFLAAMSHGKNVRSAYLAITRGEGGQNLIGTEQGDLLGMLRTQELLAARSVDGGEQFFTRAIDFGYSKTTDETLKLWGKDEIVADIVRVIRRFRPDVVVTRFTPELGGHGNHTASAALTQEAVALAGDPTKYAEQVQKLGAWSPRRLVWNVFRQSGTAPIPFGTVMVDLGAYDPVIGRSYTELAGEARTMHKSQGFGAAQNRASSVNLFQHVWGDTARQDLFDGVDLTWRRLKGGDRVQVLVDSLRKNFDDRDPSRSLALLLEVRQQIMAMPDDPWKTRKLAETDDLIMGCAGLWVDALADRPTVVAGDSLQVNLSAVNRCEVPIRILSWKLDGSSVSDSTAQTLVPSIQYTGVLRSVVPHDANVTQPYWLSADHASFRYDVPEAEMIGRAESGPTFTATVRLQIGNVELVRTLPIRYRRIDPVDGEVYRPVIVTTPVHVSFSTPVELFMSSSARSLVVNVKAVRAVGPMKVRLELPAGWTATPSVRSIERLVADETQSIPFDVHPGRSAVNGTARAVVEIEGRTVSLGVVEATYGHIPHQTLHVPASTKLLFVPMTVKARTIGYVMGPGDDVADGLRRMGCRVDLLDDAALVGGNMKGYDAIVIGVRAYNTRPILHTVKERLAAFARSGGTVVVQYQTTGRGESDDIAPLPLVVGRDRVTEEDAEMRFLNPNHRAVLHPNRLDRGDMSGWVQERGLYYASSWGTDFVPIFGANDRGEPSRNGGLLVARLGAGYYVYTGLSLFRQIPAGVPGAYRILANLVSLSRP